MASWRYPGHSYRWAVPPNKQPALTAAEVRHKMVAARVAFATATTALLSGVEYLRPPSTGELEPEQITVSHSV